MPRINFTKKAIDSLPIPPDGRRATYTDNKVQGLELRVTSKGTKTFSCQRWIKATGRPERVTLGRYPGMTIEQARKHALQVSSAIADGNNPAEVQRQLRGEPTFEDLFADYMKRHSIPRKRTWREDQRNYDRHLAPTLGRRKLSSLARKDFAQVHSAISKTAPAHANKVLALCSVVFSWAIGAGVWDGQNPAASIKKNQVRSRDRFLQHHELPRFFQSLAAEPSDTARDFFLACLLTGARRANVLAMRWDQLDLGEGVWRIPDTKNGEPQLVTLASQLVSVLEGRWQSASSPWVFPGSGKTGHYQEPRKGWERILARAQALGIVKALATAEAWEDSLVNEAAELALTRPHHVQQRYTVEIERHGLDPESFALANLRIHDLRRTLGSWQARHGASLAIIGKSLNHKSVQSTAIYARLDIDPVRDSVTRAVDNLLAAGGLSELGEVVPFDRSRS
ncbi:tyrosine-type recombinase/integrase [Modicisalibacter radicis]|uniref:tyrosine-type recombinase/integrase n=1 Tax=Halomonas sp. EAR18 TaxID=2518972 RepID=UPI00109D297C|nr:site-specific integrase [Halomonas sp. EAR18]